MSGWPGFKAPSPPESGGRALPDNGGFALAAAVSALVVIGLVVTSGFYFARKEVQSREISREAAVSFYLAELGAMKVMSEWDPSAFESLPPGGSTTIRGTTGEGSWSVTLTPVAPGRFLLRSVGSTNPRPGLAGTPTRELGIMTRLSPAEVRPRGAVSAWGGLAIGASSRIDGNDRIPPGWEDVCDSPGPAGAGILVDNLDGITYLGGAVDLRGAPPGQEQAELTSDSLLTLGSLSWMEARKRAEIVLPENTTVTGLHPDSVFVDGQWVCGRNSRIGWGDPDHPSGTCGGDFPLIYAAGDLDIRSPDAGQGILLVEGDLSIQEGFRFHGLVLVKGRVEISGGGGRIYGALRIGNAGLKPSSMEGLALVQFSRCAVSRAVVANPALTRLRPLKTRGWVDLSLARRP